MGLSLMQFGEGSKHELEQRGIHSSGWAPFWRSLCFSWCAFLLWTDVIILRILRLIILIVNWQSFLILVFIIYASVCLVNHPLLHLLLGSSQHSQGKRNVGIEKEMYLVLLIKCTAVLIILLIAGLLKSPLLTFELFVPIWSHQASEYCSLPDGNHWNKSESIPESRFLAPVAAFARDMRASAPNASSASACSSKVLPAFIGEARKDCRLGFLLPHTGASSGYAWLIFCTYLNFVKILFSCLHPTWA